MNITQEQGDNKKTDVLQETLELQKTIQKLEEEIDKLD